MWEAKFTPKEKLQNVYDLFAQVFLFKFLSKYNKSLEKIPPGFFLFQTPPFQKVGARDYDSTLEELSCVPSGMFYLGYDDKGRKIKQPNKNVKIDLEAKVKNFLKLSILSKAINI